MAIYNEHDLVDSLNLGNQLCCLERGQSLSRAGRMPDIAVLVGVLDLIDNFLYGIELILSLIHI